MTTYIITFEVNDTDRKSALKEKLKKYNGFCPIHDNCWAIITDQTPAQIIDFLEGVLVNQDRLFVIRTGTLAAWRNIYGEKNSAWLKDNL